MKNTCFAAQKTGCKILEFDHCSLNCSFRKTAVQFDLDEAAAFERLASLPFFTQKAIGDKYFNGCMPWRNSLEVRGGQKNER